MTNLGFPILTVLRLLSISCALTTVLAQSCCAVSNGPVVLSNDTTRLQYAPSLHDNTTWSMFEFKFDQSLTEIATASDNASVSFEFQGSSICICVDPTSFYAEVEVVLDGSTSSAKHPTDSNTAPSVAFSTAGLDPTATHTATMQRQTENANPGKKWNLLFMNIQNSSYPSLSLFPSETTSLASQSTSLSILTPPISSVGQPSPSQSSSTEGARKISSGTIVGAVVGTLVTVAVLGLLSFCLLRRRRSTKLLDLTPDPLITTPLTQTTPRRSRYQFHRLYSEYLPRFTAPSSVWPSSAVPNTIVPPLPTVRESHPEKITPFVLPTQVPNAPAPSPPKHPTRQRTRMPLFITNPSSNSSRSERSRSLGHLHSTTAGPDTKPVPLPGARRMTMPSRRKADNAEATLKDERRRRVKEKERAVEFEIEPAAVARGDGPTKMRRGHSMRRFFFTTNPNPSTSSGSSTTSSSFAKNSKRAVADYVRSQTQMRRKAPATSAVVHDTSPPAPHLVKSTPIVAAAPATPPLASSVPNSLPQMRERQSLTRFVTNQSTHSASVSDVQRDADAESVLSEIPRPRLDKGKGRAF